MRLASCFQSLQSLAFLQVPTSEDVVEHTHSSKASPRSHRVHGVASSASQTSQAPCDTDEECGLHGGCRRGHCVCSVFYTGPRCEVLLTNQLMLSIEEREMLLSVLPQMFLVCSGIVFVLWCWLFYEYCFFFQGVVALIYGSLSISL